MTWVDALGYWLEKAFLLIGGSSISYPKNDEFFDYTPNICTKFSVIPQNFILSSVEIGFRLESGAISNRRCLGRFPKLALALRNVI